MQGGLRHGNTSLHQWKTIELYQDLISSLMEFIEGLALGARSFSSTLVVMAAMWVNKECESS